MYLYFSEDTPGTIVDLLTGKSWAYSPNNVVEKKTVRETAAAFQRDALSRVEVPQGFYTVSQLAAIVQG